MDYYCKDCGQEAFVEDGVVRRTCTHNDSTVIAPRTVAFWGAGGAEHLSLAQRTIRALVKIRNNLGR